MVGIHDKNSETGETNLRAIWIFLLGAAALIVGAFVYAQHYRGGHYEGGGVIDDPIAQGGRGYDNWWAEYRLPKPDARHPAYPATGKATGANTWRCKECHGWDYLGRAGAYGAGSHFTGIKGIRSDSGKLKGTIMATLQDSNHQYGDLLNTSAMNQIAGFVVDGQIDMSELIRPDKSVAGTASSGRVTFDRYCAACHGSDGREIDFKPGAKTPEFLGTIAQSNPWEALHKLRNGHPGASGQEGVPRSFRPRRGRGMRGHRMMRSSSMPAMRAVLSKRQQADLLSHLQTMPSM
jgi:mono/diheme cytochrome c family protein